jgi:hypothetical protein
MASFDSADLHDLRDCAVYQERIWTGPFSTEDRHHLLFSGPGLCREPILKEFHRRTGISVNAKYDSKAVKTVGLVNAIIAERERLRCHVLWNNGVMHAVNLKKMGLLAPHVHPVRKKE